MDKAVELLRELAGKLGQTVETLWPEVIAFNAIFSLISILCWAVVVIIAWGVFIYFRSENWFIEDKYNFNEPGPKLISGVVALVISLLFLAFVAFNAPVVINPTGYVVQRILDKG